MTRDDVRRLYDRATTEIFTAAGEFGEPRRNANAALAAFRVMDEAVNASQSQPFACGKGCSHCCYLHTDITAGEAFVLAAAVKRMPEPERHAVIGRLVENSTGQRTTSYRDRFFASNACALLDLGTNTCTVYDVRPTNCRKWHSLDAGRCKSDRDTAVYKGDDVPFPLDHSAMTAASAVYRAHKHAISEPMGDLHEGVLLALAPDAEAKFAAEEGVFDGWQTTHDIAVAEDYARRL